MEYSLIRSELFEFIYNNKHISLEKKRKILNYLSIGIYKKQIIEYMSLNISVEELKDKFWNNIVDV
jgi:hypothetical protein